MLVGDVAFVPVTVVRVSPQPLDLKRILADGIGSAEVFDHAGDGERMKRHLVDLAVPAEAVVGGELHEYPHATAPMRRWSGDNESLYVRDFHGKPLTAMPEPGQYAKNRGTFVPRCETAPGKLGIRTSSLPPRMEQISK